MPRYYDIDLGNDVHRKYPSVTTILSVISKPALVNWAAKVERDMVIDVSANLYDAMNKGKQMPRTWWITTLETWIGKQRASTKILNKAGEIGSQCHALIEWTLKGELCYKLGPSPEIGPEAQWAFSRWQEWRQRVQLKPLAVEQVVWSDEHCYAGTLDLIAEVKGELTVIDWKSGKSIYPEAYLQNAAYRRAVKEMGHGDAKKGLIVRLPKVKTDPDFEVAEVDDSDEELFRMFLHAKELWKWQQMNSKKWEEDEIKIA
jgi:hypothetical protein